MPYAQKNYPQKLGNGSFTIAEAGCLLTAICNGLERLDGKAPDPPTLNQFYLEHGLYIRDSDGANEDLAWSSITQYDPTIVVTQVGTGALPPSANAIVKFHYNSVQTGTPIDHYCWVDHIDGGEVYIIDSWDGLVKGPSGYVGVYHQPIAWGTFIKNAPAPVAPAPPAAPVALPGNTNNTYTVVKEIPGYRTSGQAAARSNAADTVAPEKYYVYNSFNGMVNVTRVPGIPGSWINPGDNVVEAPVAPAPATVPPPAPAAPAVPDWRTSYIIFRNKFGDAEPRYYVALRDITVPDLEGTQKDLSMHKYSVVSVGGTFVKDNITYARPKSGADKFLWYGIPMTDASSDMPNLELESDIYNPATDTATRIVTKTVKPRDYLVLATAKVEKAYDTMEKVMDVFRPKKTKK